MKRLVLFHGDKGGVGKSYVAHLTTAVLLDVGNPITLIDGDAKNPGLYRSFNLKPGPVLRINARKPDGVDAMVEAFLEASGDVLIDLPAGGSDTTAAFVGTGSAAGTIDINSLMKEVDGRLTVFFVLDQGRDGLVALIEELKVLPRDVTDWIIVRNHRHDEPFDRLTKWLDENAAQVANAIFVDMPSLDRKVVEALVTAKKHIGEIESDDDFSMLSKLRAKSALRVWRRELEKAGFVKNA